MKDLDILIDPFIGVSIGINTDKDRLQVKILCLLGCPHIINSLGHLHQRDRAHIRAVSKSKVDQVVFAFHVAVREWLSLGIVQHPWTSNISLTRVLSGPLKLISIFLAFTFVLLLSGMHNIGVHEGTTECEKPNGKHKIGESSITVELSLAFFTAVVFIIA